MTDEVQKIRNEVERLQHELIQEREKGYGSDADDACILELQNVLTYIDSLQEEPVSSDLEKAAKKVGQKYFPDKDNIWARPNYEAVKAEYAFKEGAKWQEAQMINKACKWLKEHKEHPFIGCEDPCLSGYLTDEFIEDFKKYMEE